MAFRMKTGLEEAQVTPPHPMQTSPTSWPRPSLSEYGPRQVRTSKAGRVSTAIFGAVGLISFLVGGLVVNHEQAQAELLVKKDVMTQGKIAALTPRRDSDEDDRMTFTFTTVEGKRFIHNTKVKRRQFNTMQVGDTVDVTYLPESPSENRLGRFGPEEAQRENLMNLLVVGLIGGTFVGLAGLMSYLSRREGRILSDWIATTGQVLEVKPMAGKNGSSYALKVAYRLPKENPREVKVVMNRKRNLVVNPGGFIDVLYDPNNPTKFMVRENITMAEIDPMF